MHSKVEHSDSFFIAASPSRHLTFQLAITTLVFVLCGATFAQPPDANLTAEYKAEIVARVIKLLNDEYVLPDKAIVAANEIQRRLDNGDFDEIADLQTFANRLTGTLDVIDDWHLGVNYSSEPISEDYDYWNQSEEDIAARSALLNHRNYGFEKVERLAGNIGYIEIRDFFYEKMRSEETLASAMQFIEHTDGLIIDLRRNGGGQVEIIQLLITYLLDEKVLIGTTQYRKENRVVELWTLDEVAGSRFSTGKPVYVVVSGQTFSAAEAFTYALQTLNRVTVFGEVTIGGAHPTDNMRLDDHLMIRMPVAESIDPRTGSNWQYLGIQPDHEADADEAFDIAYKEMLGKLIQESEDDAARAEKEAALRYLLAQ